jgi:predicted PurR-regulated permease PerM
MVLAVFAVGQMLESFLLTPWLVGDKIGLHPVAVIFAIMAGGQLFGFTGVLLALPVAAVAMVLLRYLHQRYTESRLYGANDVDPDTPVSRIIVLNDDDGSDDRPPPDAPKPGA